MDYSSLDVVLVQLGVLRPRHLRTHHEIILLQRLWNILVPSEYSTTPGLNATTSDIDGVFRYVWPLSIGCIASHRDGRQLIAFVLEVCFQHHWSLQSTESVSSTIHFVHAIFRFVHAVMYGGKETKQDSLLEVRNQLSLSILQPHSGTYW